MRQEIDRIRLVTGRSNPHRKAESPVNLPVAVADLPESELKRLQLIMYWS
jgi:hypothetical protein